ncbi:MAG: Fic family protein [Coriobacteriales bacterium]|jgi:Fic family protein|nr:Fic family protein [Coriobacteriales bacterium]
MGYYCEEFWQSLGEGRSRVERRSGAYRYYVPTKLTTLDVKLDSDVVADIANAERALLAVAANPGPLRDIDGLSRFLLRAEAISSSHIEGLRLGAKRLMQAELNESEPHTFKADATAAEIVGNIKALRLALNRAVNKEGLALCDLLNIHQALLEGSPLAAYAGKVREVQNWIGGNSYNPLGASHVPPAPELVVELLDDLTEYCNRADVSPVQQAALAHAQFETIHPFVDGNGRAGRALIQVVLRRRQLTSTFAPPISLILATHAQSYIAGLNSVRFEGEQPDAPAMKALNEWLSFFAGACLRACEEMRGFTEHACEIVESWRRRLGKTRRNSALDHLLDALVGMPVFTVKSAAANLGTNFQSTNLAVERLVDGGIVKPLNAVRRNRAYEVPEVLDAFRVLERQLASPTGDTSIGRPTRPVPFRQ